MGVMLPETQLCVTPHPVTLEGQRHMVAAMEDREKLGAFLARTVPEWDRDCWEVRINGRVVPHEILDCVRPKDRTLIEVRGAVKKQALYIVAFAALTYFTFGLGSATAGAWGAGAAAGAFGGGIAGALFATAIFVAGSVLINKVLGPKVGKAGGDREQGEVYRLGAARNRARPYEPVGLLFGSVRIAPDYLSQPYTWYEADDQYLAMTLTPGVNVHHVGPLYNGDALLSSYQGVEVWHSGFPGMPEQPIPLYSNADQVAGGSLDAQGKNQPGQWVQRTTSDNTVNIQVDVEYQLFDFDSKGRPHPNQERFEVQYRAVGSVSWQSFGNYHVVSRDTKVKRQTFSRNVSEGAYDVRVRIAGLNNPGQNASATFTWTTLRSIQADNATYNGIGRIGIRMRASGQLNGTPDEIRCVVHSRPIPVWKGAQWVTERTSNPGAQILAYARGIASGGQRVAGMGMPDHKIDIPALQAFMLHCAANGYTYDYWLTEPRNHDEVLNSIARAGFGQITRANGKLSIVWAADEQPLSGVVNMATIKKGSFQVDYTFANAADGIEATWFDAEAWETKTLRVPAPGVTTMLNPAQLQLEGVTNEAHAAQLARWHLAQSLYQYKDISYNTDIEHLSYRRLSMLALQHDLTQWGYGGRLVSAVNNAGVVTLTLDEPVPAPAAGNAFIGLRIPGERVYRVFGIVPFTGESDTLTLVGAWPSDAALPGNSDGNPAHDTIWTYDFKQTPGLRVRVVAIEPESDLKGARVAVVPEGPEFWNYVKTGEYIPAASGSLLQTRPVASNLKVTEQQVVQGDTVFTELSVAFDISGPVGETIVSMAGADGILSEVARTTERSATWRIPGAGTYTITVRPFSPEGQAGVAASIVYTTLGADAPPVLVDLFDVEQRGGGVRLYTWGWLDDTIQSADFAGVEIRYTTGEVASPVWDDMTPVGETGYFTAPFEAVIPTSGTWTFACRSRNTSGTLSTGMRVITRVLSGNLVEVIDDITAGQLAEQERLDQEIADRLQADIAVAEAAGADATAKANAARDAAIARVDALAAEVGEIVNAPEWSPDEDYIAGWLVRYNGHLYRAIVANTAYQPDISPSQWQYIGQFASAAEVAAAALELATTTASELEAEAVRINSLQARMPAGNDVLETKARVDQVNQASVDRDGALAQDISVVSAQAGTAASTATSAMTAAQDAASIANSAQATANGAQSTATSALAASATNASAITQVRAGQAGGGNMLANADFGAGSSGLVLALSQWGGLASGVNWGGAERVPQGGTQFGFTAGGYPQGVVIFDHTSEAPATEGENWIASARVGTLDARAKVQLLALDANGSVIDYAESGWVEAFPGVAIGSWPLVSARFPNGTPPGTTRVRWRWETDRLRGANPYSWVTQISLAKGALGQTQPGPWAAGATGLASATFALQVAQDAQVTLTTNVNGHVTGMVSKNDGRRGVVAFLADVFEIISSGSVGVRFTRRNGGYFMRFYAASIQLVLGINFGAANNLCFWYGPNVGEENCNKANGTIWFDNAGSAYFKGAIIAGTIRNGGYSTSQAGAVTYTTGPFSTTGNPISVNASYAFAQAQTASAMASRINPGTGSTSATLQLWRSVGGGAWQLVGSQNITGTLSIQNNSDAPSYANYSMSGAITYVDNEGGTATRNYEVRMLNRQIQELVVSNGSITSIDTQQQTGVTTGEN